GAQRAARRLGRGARGAALGRLPRAEPGGDCPRKGRVAEMNESRFKTLLIGLAVSILAGCSSVLAPRPDPSRFFALTAETGASSEGTAQNVAAAGGLTYGVGPVSIPDYLDRNEICMRLSASELAYSPTDRWAAPLRVSIPTVLAQDLARQLPQGHVV